MSNERGDRVMKVYLSVTLDVDPADVLKRTGDNLTDEEVRAHVIDVAQDALKMAVYDSELGYFATVARVLGR